MFRAEVSKLKFGARYKKIDEHSVTLYLQNSVLYIDVQCTQYTDFYKHFSCSFNKTTSDFHLQM